MREWFECDTLLVLGEPGKLIPEKHGPVVQDVVREQQDHLVQLTEPARNR